MKNNKTLHLVLNKQWFDMIKNGVKKEEYRDDNGWMRSRLFTTNGTPRHYDTVTFQHGYKSDSDRIVLEFKGLHSGTGRKEWGAVPGVNYFVLKLGEIIK